MAHVRAGFVDLGDDVGGGNAPVPSSLIAGLTIPPHLSSIPDLKTGMTRSLVLIYGVRRWNFIPKDKTEKITGTSVYFMPCNFTPFVEGASFDFYGCIPDKFTMSYKNFTKLKDCDFPCVGYVDFYYSEGKRCFYNFYV